MESRLIKIFLIALVVFCFNTAKSEVYWLRNLGNTINLGGKKTADVENLLEQQNFLEDEMIINGYSTVMRVGSSAYSFKELLQKLEQIDSRLITVIDGKNLVFTVDLSEKFVQKYLVSEVGNSFNAVVFSVKLPKKFPKPYWKGNWGLLLCNGGAVLDRIVEYPKRKSFYFSLSNINNPALEMEYIRRNLESRGFKSLGGGVDSSLYESGDVFLKEKTGEMISVAFDAHGNGIFYYRGEQEWD